MKKHALKGFTLIELLVVIAIIGVLSTLAVVALNTARQKSRDSKRVADIKQIQTALELYYADQNGYPAATAVTLGDSNNNSLCETSAFSGTCTGTAYMGIVPLAALPVDGTCTAGENSYIYDSSVSNAYTLTFCLGGVTGTLGAGAHTASPSGIQ